MEFCTYILLAVSFLSTGPSNPQIETLRKNQEVFRRMLPYCQMIGIQCQILDEREKRYVFTKTDEFVGDLSMVYHRAKDLADAPPVQDSVLLPPRPIVSELLLMNRAYNMHLDKCIDLYPHSVSLKRAKEENKILYDIWDAVRDAKCEYYYVHIRRQALKKLVDNLGEKYYIELGKIPHVPVWYFTCVR